MKDINIHTAFATWLAVEKHNELPKRLNIKENCWQQTHLGVKFSNNKFKTNLRTFRGGLGGPGPVLVVELAALVQLEHVDRLPVAADDDVVAGGAEGHGVDVGELPSPPELVQNGVLVVVHLEHPYYGPWN